MRPRTVVRFLLSPSSPPPSSPFEVLCQAVRGLMPQSFLPGPSSPLPWVCRVLRSSYDSSWVEFQRNCCTARVAINYSVVIYFVTRFDFAFYMHENWFTWHHGVLFYLFLTKQNLIRNLPELSRLFRFCSTKPVVELVQDTRRQRMAQASTFRVLFDVAELAIGIGGLFITGWSLHLSRVRARTERTATAETGKPTPCP